MTLQQVRALVRVPDGEMLPPPELFLHASRLHGPAHVGRVMIHALRLVEETGRVEEMPALWAAVYLHDIARTHDGSEPRHGANAWTRLADLPGVRTLFAHAGVREGDLPAIQAAVTRHSSGEARQGEPHRQLLELLKDADGLDRVRLGDLDPRYLRTPAARTMVEFAERLYEETQRGDVRSDDPASLFAFLWGATDRLVESPLETRRTR